MNKRLQPAQLRERLLKAGLCTIDSLSGCSEGELKEIEKVVGRRIPEEYKDIMRVIGQYAGDFMSDVEMFFPAILTLTEDARKHISDELQLPDDSFVIADRYGEQILFLRLDDMPETPVYKWFDEQPAEFTKIFDSVWEFIEEELEGHEWQARDYP